MSAKDAQALEEIKQKLPPDLPMNVEEVFPKLSGFGVKGAIKRRLEHITNAQPLLSQVLEDGETIRSFNLAIVNYPWEMVMMGAWAQLINRTLVVVTDRRVLLIHCDSKGRPESFMNEVLGENIKKIKGGFLNSLQIQTGKGTRNFQGIIGANKKAFETLFPPNANATGGFTFACPSCFAKHDTHMDKCTRCNADFKSPKTAAMRSLFLPGLGDWYLGHKALAAMEMFGAVITWVIVVALLASGEAAAYVFAPLILLFANGADALLTYHQGKKGLMSSDGALPSQAGGMSTATMGEAPPTM